MLSADFLQKLRLPDLDDVNQYIRSVSTPMLFSMGAVAAATTYYLATRPKAIPRACDLNMQSVEVPVSLWVEDCSSISVLWDSSLHLFLATRVSTSYSQMCSILYFQLCNPSLTQRNEAKICHSVTVVMPRAWYIGQKLVCNVHSDGRLCLYLGLVLPL